jgi:hypothetical protein
MSYDRPLFAVANGVFDQAGRFYNFTTGGIYGGSVLPALPGKRYYIREIAVTADNDGAHAISFNSVSTTIESVQVVLLNQVVPGTFASSDGFSIQTTVMPHVLTDVGVTVNSLQNSSVMQGTITYAVIDEVPV